MPAPPDTDVDDGCQRYRSDCTGPWVRYDCGPAFVGRPFGIRSVFRYVWLNAKAERHRENGPAEARDNGYLEWAIDGTEVRASRVIDGKIIHYPSLEEQLRRNHLT